MRRRPTVIVKMVLEPMTSPGRTRSNATESDCHRLGLLRVDGGRFGDVSTKVVEPMTSPDRARSNATESDCHRLGLLARRRVQHVPSVRA